MSAIDFFCTHVLPKTKYKDASTVSCVSVNTFTKIRNLNTILNKKCKYWTIVNVEALKHTDIFV